MPEQTPFPPERDKVVRCGGSYRPANLECEHVGAVIRVGVLEEDDISWRTAFNLLLEISDINKRLQRRSHSYFLANKAGTDLIDVAGKLKVFSFLPPLPHDVWMQKLFAKATSAALEKEFENTDFFRQTRSRVWQEIASIFGVSKPLAKDGFTLSSWFRKQSESPAPRSVQRGNGATSAPHPHREETQAQSHSSTKSPASPPSAEGKK